MDKSMDSSAKETLIPVQVVDNHNKIPKKVASNITKTYWRNEVPLVARVMALNCLQFNINLLVKFNIKCLA